MKANGEPIVMVTAYDYPSATVAEAAGVDLVLVGDSAANVVLGYDRTELVSMDEMIMLGKAVRRGLKTPLMIGDMPMGSYEASDELAIRNAQRLVKETGCQAVKLEAGGVSVERARAIVHAGIPVMGHLGLTPQTATALGGYKAQGKTREGRDQAVRGRPRPAVGRLLRDRLRGGPRGDHRRDRRASSRSPRSASAPARRPPARSSSSTTCSASPPATWRNSSSATPTSTRRWSRRSSSYGDEVRRRQFPEPDHVYSVEPAELDEFRRYLSDESLAWRRAGSGSRCPERGRRGTPSLLGSG